MILLTKNANEIISIEKNDARSSESHLLRRQSAEEEKLEPNQDYSEGKREGERERKGFPLLINEMN